MIETFTELALQCLGNTATLSAFILVDPPLLQIFFDLIRPVYDYSFKPYEDENYEFVLVDL